MYISPLAPITIIFTTLMALSIILSNCLEPNEPKIYMDRKQTSINQRYSKRAFCLLLKNSLS